MLMTIERLRRLRIKRLRKFVSATSHFHFRCSNFSSRNARACQGKEESASDYSSSRAWGWQRYSASRTWRGYGPFASRSIHRIKSWFRFFGRLSTSTWFIHRIWKERHHESRTRSRRKYWWRSRASPRRSRASPRRSRFLCEGWWGTTCRIWRIHRYRTKSTAETFRPYGQGQPICRRYRH